MKGAGVKQSWCRRAETTTFIQVVQINGFLLWIIFLVSKNTHSHAHPEELRTLQPTGDCGSLVYDEVSIIKGLYAKIIKIQVGRRI